MRHSRPCSGSRRSWTCASAAFPNRLTAGLALLYPIYVLVSPAPVAWPAALGIAAVVFLIGLGLFAGDLIGGGDVKLIAALSLWAGPEHFVWFMLVTTLTGGALSLICLWYRRWGGVIEARLAALGLAATASSGTAPPEAPQSVDHRIGGHLALRRRDRRRRHRGGHPVVEALRRPPWVRVASSSC